MDFDNFALGNTDYGNFMSNAYKILTKKNSIGAISINNNPYNIKKNEKTSISMPFMHSIVQCNSRRDYMGTVRRRYFDHFRN